jgi:hypothetical protein
MLKGIVMASALNMMVAWRPGLRRHPADYLP